MVVTNLSTGQIGTSANNRSNRNALSVLLACVLVGCSRNPQMTEQLPYYTLAYPREVPIVLVAQITEPASPAGTFHPARYDSKLITRLYRIRVKVENVFQGDVAVGESADFFLFVDNRNSGSSQSRRDLPKGSRQLLFLERDHGQLRAIEDNFTSGFAIRILSGAHPNIKTDSSKSIEEQILEILLSRGANVSDMQMEAVINEAPRYGIFGDALVIRELQRVADQETGPVRQSACSVLKEFKSTCEDVRNRVGVQESEIICNLLNTLLCQLKASCGSF